MEVVPVRRCSSWPETIGCSGVLSRCIFVVKHPKCVLPQLLSRFHALSKSHSAWSLWSLTDWSFCPVARTRSIFLASKNVIKMTLAFDFDCLISDGLGDIRDFLIALTLGFWVEVINHVSSSAMTLWRKSGTVWRCSAIIWCTCVKCSFWISFCSSVSQLVEDS